MLARRRRARRAVGLEQPTVATEPGGMLAAARKTPATADAVAARGGDGTPLNARTPGEHRVAGLEDVSRRRLVQKCRRHGAAERLSQAPGGTGVGGGDRLGDLGENVERRLRAAEKSRQRQAEKLRLVHGRAHLVGKGALGLDAIAGCSDRRQQPARSFQAPVSRRQSLLVESVHGLIIRESQIAVESIERPSFEHQQLQIRIDDPCPVSARRRHGQALRRDLRCRTVGGKAGVRLHHQGYALRRFAARRLSADPVSRPHHGRSAGLPFECRRRAPFAAQATRHRRAVRHPRCHVEG